MTSMYAQLSESSLVGAALLAADLARRAADVVPRGAASEAPAETLMKAALLARKAAEALPERRAPAESHLIWPGTTKPRADAQPGFASPSQQHTVRRALFEADRRPCSAAVRGAVGAPKDSDALEVQSRQAALAVRCRSSSSPGHPRPRAAKEEEEERTLQQQQQRDLLSLAKYACTGGGGGKGGGGREGGGGCASDDGEGDFVERCPQRGDLSCEVSVEQAALAAELAERASLALMMTGGTSRGSIEGAAAAAAVERSALTAAELSGRAAAILPCREQQRLGAAAEADGRDRAALAARLAIRAGAILQDSRGAGETSASRAQYAGEMMRCAAALLPDAPTSGATSELRSRGRAKHL